jgi:multiple sugar transport system permease protein
MTKEMQRFGKGMAFLSPWLFGFLVFTLFPLGMSLYYSFHKYNEMQPPRFTGMDNYANMMHDATFWKAAGNTFTFGAMSIPAGLLVSLGLALLLNARIPGQMIWRAVIFMPSLMPVVASAMIWMWLLNSKLGLINVVLWEGLRINGPAWLANPRWVMPALTMMSVWGVGNAVVIYLAGLQSVPRELYEAAELDGAGIFGRLWHVTLPMLSPVIFYNLVIGIIGTFQYFDMPYIMSNIGLGPDNSAYLMSSYIYDNSFRYLRMGYASALAWILLLIIFALTALAFATSKRWVHYQGK